MMDDKTHELAVLKAQAKIRLEELKAQEIDTESRLQTRIAQIYFHCQSTALLRHRCDFKLAEWPGEAECS